MKYNSGARKLNRTLRAFRMGVSIGVVTLCVVIAPTVIRDKRKAEADAIRQEQLTAACGEAFDSFSMAEVSLTVLLDGAPRDGTSVAADRGFFTVPQDGTVCMSLAPNTYRFTAGYQNRTVYLSGAVSAGQTGAFVLDVGKAPAAPELQIWDVPAEQDTVIRLEATGADTVTASHLPDGVSIAKQNGAFVLLIDGSDMGAGFWCLRLTAENQYGQATLYVGLRVPRGKEITPIYTADDLPDIRRDMSGHFVLMNDIDMSAVEDWVPIGTEQNPFTGIFDGGGHEIMGFHASEEVLQGKQFALFGTVKNAELKDVVFRAPMIAPKIAARDIGGDFLSSILAGVVRDSLVERCGSFGGTVSPSDGSAAGLLGGVVTSIVRDCFNSTNVMCSAPNRYLPNTGGIMGAVDRSHVSRCANEGEIKGNHLSGGISGYASSADITRCINSGYIWGSTIVGAVPAGGIVQSNDFGMVGYSYFVRAQAAIGAHCNGGVVAAVVPIMEQALRAPDKLPHLGQFAGQSPQWAFASLDARGPVPYGIFKTQTPAPVCVQAGNAVTLVPMHGVRYFYTMDGSDPRTSCFQPVESLRVTLKKDQTLLAFAAQKGCRDSEIVTVTGGREWTT